VELLLSIERVLWIASVVAEALVVIRFVQQGLWRKYPFFVAYFAFEAIGSIVLMQHDLKTRDYAEAYRVYQLIPTLLCLGVAAELYERICRHFPGIGVFRPVMAGVLVSLAALVSIITFRPNIAGQWGFPQTTVVVIRRFEVEILAVAFILTWIFLRFVLSIRQPFRPNVLVHWTIATVYFGAAGAFYVGVLLGGGASVVVYPLNCAMLAVQLGCFVAWFCFMRRAGEELPAFPRLSTAQVRAVENYNRELLETLTSLPDQISARQAENRDTPLHRAPLR
jgi:hypothetical protein